MNNNFFAIKRNQILVTLVLVAMIVALSAYAYQSFKRVGDWGVGPTTINVLGIGEVDSVPDVAQFSFSVKGEGADASVAQEASGKIINDLMAFLSEQGIEDRDIKTQNYNLFPKYRYEQRPCLMGQYCPPGEQIADGFTVSQTISVKVRDTKKAGDLLSGVGKKGATDISGLNFIIDDEEGLKAEARTLAIADAKDKAEKLAKDLDVRLVRMISFYEDQPYNPGPYPMNGMALSAKEEARDYSAPRIPTGENTITSQVNLTYEIK